MISLIFLTKRPLWLYLLTERIIKDSRSKKWLSSAQSKEQDLKGYPNLLSTNQARSHCVKGEERTLGTEFIVNGPGFRLTNNQLPERHSNAMGFLLAGSSRDLFHHFQCDQLKIKPKRLKVNNFFQWKYFFTKKTIERGKVKNSCRRNSGHVTWRFNAVCFP